MEVDVEFLRYRIKVLEGELQTLRLRCKPGAEVLFDKKLYSLLAIVPKNQGLTEREETLLKIFAVLYSAQNENFDSVEQCCQEIIRRVEELKHGYTSERVAVVHARWKDNGNGTVSCSRCATWFQKEREPYLLFCGYCGAKMDGKRRDEDER